MAVSNDIKLNSYLSIFIRGSYEALEYLEMVRITQRINVVLVPIQVATMSKEIKIMPKHNATYRLSMILAHFLVDLV